MEETAERLERVSRLEALGPEVEALFAKGLARAPLVIGDRVDPVVRQLRAGNSVALVGPSGAGKRSIAYGIRRSGVWGEGPQMTIPLDGSAAHPSAWPLYRTTVRHWMDGALYVGNLEQKINGICRSVGGDSIVLFESVHQAIGAWQGRHESLDLVDLMVEVADHPRIHLVVTATAEGWVALKEKKPDFVARFVVVDVAPPDELESRLIITFGLGDVDCHCGAIEEALRLASRYFPNESPLGPAMRMLRSASAAQGGPVEAEGVRRACARELGVQRHWVGSDRTRQASEIIAELEQSVIGQREACSAVANDLVAGSLGLIAPGGPVSYVLAGTPGVGKTSLACAVQRLLGGARSEPWRIDCSEYAASSLDVLRLLSNEPGSLVTGLARRPGTVVLLDEIDRLHPSARDLLYQMLGEGRITSLEGETISCSNAVVFMTTNAGSKPWMRSGMDCAAQDQAAAFTRRACVEMLGPAIASRVTRILVFPPLRSEHTESIVRAELSKVETLPGIVERGLSIDVSGGLVAALAAFGRSNTSGARGLQKVIHEVVMIPISRYLNERPGTTGTLQIDALEVAGNFEGVRVRESCVDAGLSRSSPDTKTSQKVPSLLEPMMWN